MKKLMLALVAGCMSAAVAGAYAASGSPADTDKAGRMGQGATTAGEMGAVQPTPGKAGPDRLPGSKGGASSSASGTGASATTSGAGGAAASSSSGMDEPKKGRRARASKG